MELRQKIAERKIAAYEALRLQPHAKMLDIIRQADKEIEGWLQQEEKKSK